ncbi:hypothetical protein FA95DRAFT_328777 [Auriscalpium vulgare]|uniref:Uncharacterized protein n=1 Tax=Auriscalpium vulgare TaxID=40419 RepID=A0ACB8RK10_9AGAM|nr:hypothetical protein FA95DRAFT_328777 [Auriscalpium vulgare]
MTSPVFNGLPRTAQLHTPDPCKLRPSDYNEVSSRLRLNYTAWLAENQHIGTGSGPVYSKTVPSPANSRGFLYFHAPSREVRLCLASPDPHRFAEGTDLARPHGAPWCVTHTSPANLECAAGMRTLLLQDGLVTEAQLAAWAQESLIGTCGHE